MALRLSSKEEAGYNALARALSVPIVSTSLVKVLYPGSGDRLEHAMKIVDILCKTPSKIIVHLVDPILSLAVLEKKCAGLDNVDVHAYPEMFAPGHIPNELTIYFERAFDLFREEWMIDAIVEKMISGGLFVSDAKINHHLLRAISLPEATKDIGFYPYFGIYQKV